MAIKKLDRYTRKSYAMRRMTLAIERAIKRPTRKEKERAARWAAAWGLLCGIRTDGVNLKACDVQSLESRIEQTSASITTFGSFSLSDLDSAVQPKVPSSAPPAVPMTAPTLTAWRVRLPSRTTAKKRLFRRADRGPVPLQRTDTTIVSKNPNQIQDVFCRQ